MATSDRVEPLLSWLRGVALGSLLHFRVITQPRPRNSPRVTRYGGVFYSKGYEEYYADSQKQLAEQVTARPSSGRLGVVLDVACKKPKTGKLTDPIGDVDNYAKGVLDAGTKAGLWGDDVQIAALAVSKRYADPGEEPGVGLWMAAIS